MAAGQFTMFRSSVTGIEAVTAASGHTFPKHTHDSFGIGVIERGAQRSMSGHGVVEARAGDVISVNPNEVHDGTPIGDDRTWSMLYFEPDLIAAVVDDFTEGRVRGLEFPDPVIRNWRTAKRFLTLFAAVTAPGQDKALLLAEAMLVSLIADVMLRSGDESTGNAVPAAIQQARDLIDEDPTVAITLDDLARACGLSRFQVVRGFSKATGLTPHAYLLQRRVRMARRMIAVGTSLAETASACSFADQSHMTRIFVRSYGVSPGAYAEAVR